MNSSEGTDKEELPDLVFVEIEHKRYALPARDVVEVLPIVEPTPMPAWPTDALGVINVRGELLPLVDVAPLLGRPPITIRTSSLIVVVLAFDRRWGLVVDAVHGVERGRIRRSEQPEATDGPSVMLGVTVEANGLVVVVLTPWGLLHSLQAIARDLTQTIAATD